MRIAEERGLLDHGGRGCLERWLAHAPTAPQLKSHLAILSELARSHRNMGSDFDADSEQLMIAWCQDVADAAGGLLGLRSACHDAEHAALKTIAAAVDVRNARALARVREPAVGGLTYNRQPPQPGWLRSVSPSLALTPAG